MGRHRKPTSTGRSLAKVGALTVMATAPLGLVGTAMAAPLSSPDRHSSDRWSHDSDDSGNHSHYLRHRHSSDYDESDGYDSNSNYRSSGYRSSDSDEPEQWSVEHSTHAAERRSAGKKARSAQHRWGTSSSSARRSESSVTTHPTSWDKLARCESTNNWAANTGNGYKGGLQFNDSTWRAYGGSQYAHSANQASRAQQIAVAEKVQQQQGWAAWPGCSHKLGYA
jgi:hypothetical protein